MNIPSGLRIEGIITSIMIIAVAIFSLPASSQQPSKDMRMMPEFVPEALLHQPAESATSTFSGGASSILEVHGAWTVLCRIGQSGKTCDVVQARKERLSGRRVLTIYVRATAVGRARVLLLLPPELKRGSRISLFLDSNALGQTRYLPACSEESCAISYIFNTIAFKALRNGRELTLKIIDPATGGSGGILVPLAGLSSAVQRSLDLLYGTPRPQSSGGPQ